MASPVGTEMKLRARQVKILYDFLRTYHQPDIIVEGHSVRLKAHHTISIKKGYSSYTDFKTGETGNPIDCLVKFLGYDFISAVRALCEYNGTLYDDMTENTQNQPEITPPPVNLPPAFPEPEKGPYKRLYAYMMKRGILSQTLKNLIDSNLMYESADKHNIVFISRDRDFGDMKGTYTYGAPFKGIVAHSRPDGFWGFGRDTSTVYICEACMDAISLYEIHRLTNHTLGYYISICGEGKQGAIDRIKREFTESHIVLAVDRDDAGNGCRTRNNDLDCILPVQKDWNEDLQTKSYINHTYDIQHQNLQETPQPPEVHISMATAVPPDYDDDMGQLPWDDEVPFPMEVEEYGEELPF